MITQSEALYIVRHELCFITRSVVHCYVMNFVLLPEALYIVTSEYLVSDCDAIIATRFGLRGLPARKKCAQNQLRNVLNPGLFFRSFYTCLLGTAILLLLQVKSASFTLKILANYFFFFFWCVIHDEIKTC